LSSNPLAGGGGIFIQNSVPSALLEVSFLNNTAQIGNGNDLYDPDDHAGISSF
jgi:hypothetical protein